MYYLLPKDEYGRTHLMRAIINNDIDLVKYIIEIPHIDLEEKDLSNATALFYAISNNQIEVVNLLINKNCDVNISNSRKITPLMISCKLETRDIASMLLFRGAKFKDIFDKYGYEAIDYACQYQNSMLELFFNWDFYVKNVPHDIANYDVMPENPYDINDGELFFRLIKKCIKGNSSSALDYLIELKKKNCEKIEFYCIQSHDIVNHCINENKDILFDKMIKIGCSFKMDPLLDHLVLRGSLLIKSVRNENLYFINFLINKEFDINVCENIYCFMDAEEDEDRRIFKTVTSLDIINEKIFESLEKKIYPENFPDTIQNYNDIDTCIALRPKKEGVSEYSLETKDSNIKNLINIRNVLLNNGAKTYSDLKLELSEESRI